MGTNYYLYRSRAEAELELDGFHIGKNSAGWVFHFEAYDNPNIKTVNAMKAFTRLGYIYDEYGTEYTYEEFWKIVEESKELYYGREPYILDDPENPEPHWFKRWEDEGFCFSEGEFS